MLASPHTNTRSRKQDGIIVPRSPDQGSTQDAEATRRVQELLEQGHTLGIAIDSNYYITKGGGTLDVLFRAKLGEYNGRFIHLTASIWAREIKRHLKTRIENSKEKVLNVSERDIQIFQSQDIRSKLKELRAAVEAINAAETADTLWDRFSAETHAIIVEPPPDSANRVLDWYFTQRLPFEGAGDKKHEFPDAFALHALEAYATTNGLTIVVVVTKDSGAFGHCAKTEKLLPFRDVQSALGAFDAKDLIERRRQLSEQASAQMVGTRLDRLVNRLVTYVNRPYEHRQQPWPAVTRPSFPQNPRILIKELRHYELLSFGNFGLPVSVTSIFSGPGDQPDELGSGVICRLKLKIKAVVACEISAIDISKPASNSLRQTFLLDDEIDTELTFDFASQFPFPEPEEAENERAMGLYGSSKDGVMNVEVEPLHVVIPENFEFRGFA